MILNNVKLVPGNLQVNIEVKGAKIALVSREDIAGETQLLFNNAIVFPGLINSHDHLEFNLFPMLGGKVYINYTEWGKGIHIVSKKEIADVVKIPETLRTAWGIYKNLLCGVTSVVNHGKYLHIKNPLINVIQPPLSLHSVSFDKYWKLKLNNIFKKRSPCVIHAGEGTDESVKDEITKLIQWNLIKRKMIAVHGVAMNNEQAAQFEALVWCPASNYFLFNKTAPVDKLKAHTKILFGTDSTLTSSWNIWEHLRLAKKSGLANEIDLFEMLNKIPADTWNINSGSVSEGKAADLVIVRSNNTAFPDNFFALNPEDILMVVCKGRIRLFDETLFSQLKKSGFITVGFHKIQIKGSYKYVEGDLPQLISIITNYNPELVFPVMSCNTREILQA